MGLDQTARTVTVETDAGPVAVSYRRLVIAVGSAPRLLPIPGLAQHAMTFKGVADAIRLRNHVLGMLDRADADRRNPGRWLQLRVRRRRDTPASKPSPRRRRSSRMRSSTTRRCAASANAGSSSTPLPASFRKCRARSLTTQHAHLRRQGVEILTSTTVGSVEAGTVTLTDGTRIDTETLVWAAGVAANPVVEALGLTARRSRPDHRRCRAPGRRARPTSGPSATAPPYRTQPRPGDLIRPRANTRCARPYARHLARAQHLARAGDRTVLVPQHRRRRHSRERPRDRTGLPVALQRSVRRTDHSRLPRPGTAGALSSPADPRRRAAVGGARDATSPRSVLHVRVRRATSVVTCRPRP